jgi:NTE family protein
MSGSASAIPSNAVGVLVLQGGGALGAYQAGVYEALCGGGFRPDWVAGVSIGAINAAIIAGNPPDARVKALQAFWKQVSVSLPFQLPIGNEQIRAFVSESRAAWVATFGVNGFFRPRIPPPTLLPPGGAGATSFYDTAPLRDTLERLVDFDRINARETRLSLGAVNVHTGLLRYFDNTRQTIGPEHVMASGALPPGFPPVEVDDEFYWDGGVVSNTPLEFVLDEQVDQDLLIFQVDLFNAEGPLPRTILDVMEREKDIRYASRTRHNTERALQSHEARMALRKLLMSLPEELRDAPGTQLLAKLAEERKVTVAQVVYRNKPYEGSSKDHEFSHQAMIEHWQAGIADVDHCMRRHKEKLKCRPEGATMIVDGHQERFTAGDAEVLPGTQGDQPREREVTP